MPILSVEFALFFLIFFPLYWSLARFPKGQNALLLIASLGWLYYLSIPFLLAVIGFSLIMNVVALAIIHLQGTWRKRVLSTGIVAALLNLCFFKYADFFLPDIQRLIQDDSLTILMPLGLSYYTFQSISYLVSVYKTPEIKLSVWNSLLHFSFFPTITSGPIARADSFKTYYGEQLGMAAQLKQSTPRHIINPALALSLICLGIAKKWWLAGMLADNWVSPIFENPMQYNSISVLSGVYGYTLQLFCDFSGYTDLVIGMAMLLGFQLPQNFAMPLRSVNLRDFWNRWHISLSTWIRDYIYIPLGGSRKGFWRTQLNLMIAMVLSGIWHGSTANFLLWGALHGAGLVLLNIGDKLVGNDLFSVGKFNRFFAILITFNFVAFTFVIFKTASLDDAKLVIQSVFFNTHQSLPSLSTLLFFVSLFALLAVYPLLDQGWKRAVSFLRVLPVLAWIIPLFILMILIMTLAPSGIPGFIYANF